MTTADDILTSSGAHPDRALSPECTAEVRANALDLALKVSKLLILLGKTATVSSGFRTIAANAATGGAPHSNHLTGCAVDLHDPDNALDTAISLKESVLAQCDLYRESPLHTPGWVHLQSVAPGSHDRTFTP